MSYVDNTLSVRHNSKLSSEKKTLTQSSADQQQAGISLKSCSIGQHSIQSGQKVTYLMILYYR